MPYLPHSQRGLNSDSMDGTFCSTNSVRLFHRSVAATACLLLWARQEISTDSGGAAAARRSAANAGSATLSADVGSSADLFQLHAFASNRERTCPGARFTKYLTIYRYDYRKIDLR